MAHDLVERSGKSYCGICNGVEGSSLPTDCPGGPLTQAQAAGVYRGSLDYIGGEWVKPGAPSSTDGGDAPSGDPPPQGGNSWNGSVVVEVEGDPDPDPQKDGDNTPVVVPVPVPIPVPVPGGQNTEGDPGSDDPDPEIDVNVNRG
jgi:hypothetical protein